MSAFVLISIVSISVIGIVGFFKLAPQIGSNPGADRHERMKANKNYRDGKFLNTVKTVMNMDFKNMGPVMWDFMKGNPNREPRSMIKTVTFKADEFQNSPDSGIVVTWLGHSSLLIKIDGKTFLTDPVFDKRASMISFMGPKRFDYSQQFTVEDLPRLDGVIISHDHYDHLDYRTILKLKESISRFYVPLGVGAHLEGWGVPNENIIELEWWQSTSVDEKLTLTCTPSRHFSGRGLTNRFGTLWCSWVIKNEQSNVFFGGDSGYFPGFKEIGDKYGPFDLTMLECGAYNTNWHDIHMMPEETAQAHMDLRGKRLLPIHWGKFNLSLHPWKEPIQRVLKKAEEMKATVITPEIGDILIMDDVKNLDSWWEQYE